MKAINIDWDMDGENIYLPNEIDLPDGMTDEYEISDYITEQTGFCHLGFSLESDDKTEAETELQTFDGNGISYKAFMEKYENEMVVLDVYDEKGNEIDAETGVPDSATVIEYSRRSGFWDVVVKI